MNSALGRFLMVRHGRTTANANRVLMGGTDAPLLPASLEEAEQLGRNLALGSTTVIYSSDQPRALRTAHLIGAPGRLRPTPDEHLRERHFGRYTLSTFTDLEQEPAWPAVDTHYDVRPEGGESLRDVETRVFTRLLDLHSTLAPQITLTVVGHSTCWRLVEAVLNGRRHDPFDEPIPPPLTVLEHPRTALELLRDHI
ncbi:histidine phosphatase family protein [Streptomyces sp. NPDC092296]|uniref:histidine phosphatase family protein n=1 Tax=Streptomyces sp. NPDC092296 TaxID=3366012 RepID=UPI0038229487